jgi:hypothetical protein
MEVSGQLHASAALHPLKEHPLDRRLGGPQSRSGRGGEEKNSQPLPGLEPPTIQPVAQRYTAEILILDNPSLILSLYMVFSLNDNDYPVYDIFMQKRI